MRRSLSSSLFSLAYLFTGALAALSPVTNLPITNKVVSPDGFARSAVIAGGQLPGPLLAGSKGDQFQVTVLDLLSDSSMLRTTSIHWHGIFQPDSIWADGPAFVTQCPIAPKHSFQYQFTGHQQAGTFWYHSHLGPQYCDGLRGPLVIYDPADPMLALYDVDDETTVISLLDWYHTPSTTGGFTPINRTPDSTLVNGLGRYVGGPQSPLSVINVQPGKKYRFRLINMSCEPSYLFQIDGHQFTVIEADGVTHQPVVVDSIRIFAGQRYSFILEASQPVNNYWIRANPSKGATGFAGGINSAILRYAGAPNVDPVTTQTFSTNPLSERSLHPFTPVPVPGEPVAGGADVTLNLILGFDFDTNKYTVNGATFTPPTVPILLQILSGAQSAQDLLPPGSVYTLPKNKVVELSIPSGVVGGHHPFHLHGHNFHVVRSAGSPIYNYIDPVIRDVVDIGGEGDNVTIRFVTNNSGPWFLHCHIDWHLQAGLSIVFAEDVKGIHVKAANFPSAWKQLCTIYNNLDPSQY